MGVKLFFFSGIIGLFFSCQQIPVPIGFKQKKILTSSQAVQSYLQNGDLILRSDDDLIGLTLRNMNDSDKTFSHSGMAFKNGNNWMVYHTISGLENPSGFMRCDNFDTFVNPNAKAGFAIYRYNLSATEIENLHQLFQQQYQQHLMFDTAFNLTENNAMYCTELIANNLKVSSKNRIEISPTFKKELRVKAIGSFNGLQKNISYFAIDNLYLNPWCRKIYSSFDE